jgi:hypothetical protein
MSARYHTVIRIYTEFHMPWNAFDDIQHEVGIADGRFTPKTTQQLGPWAVQLQAIL